MSDKKTAAPTATAPEMIEVSRYAWQPEGPGGPLVVLPPKTLAMRISLAECEEIFKRHNYVPGYDNTGGKPPTGPMAPDVRIEIKAACNARAYHLAVARDRAKAGR